MWVKNVTKFFENLPSEHSSSRNKGYFGDSRVRILSSLNARQSEMYHNFLR